MTSYETILAAASQSLSFYTEGQRRGPAFHNCELAFRLAHSYITSGHEPSVIQGLNWFDHLFAELQRCGYATAPDKVRARD